MKVKLDGKEYEIDIDKAKELGLCKEVEDFKLESFNVGDIFKSKTSSPVLIVQSRYIEPHLYSFAGLDGLRLFSNIRDGFTYEDMLRYLNKGRYVKKGNINKEIKSLISSNE